MPSADKRARQKENTRLAREAREAAVKRKRRNRTLLSAGSVALVLILFVVLLNIIKGDDTKKKSTTTTTTTPTPKTTKLQPVTLDPTKDYSATITTNLGNIVVALDTKNSPKGSARFIALANNGTYNNSRWHRIVKDFVIQGGAPGGNIALNAGNAIVGEVPTDHYPVGAVAAAKTGADPAGTFDSQFFIVTGAAQGASLPNDYARFGTVVSGMDVAKKIEALPVGSDEAPTKKATIDKVTITEAPAATTTPTTATATPTT